MKMNKKLIISGLFMACTLAFAAAEPKYISPNSDGIQDELVIPMNSGLEPCDYGFKP